MAWNVTLPKAEWYGRQSKNSDLTKLINELKDQDAIAIDTETTGLTIWKDQPLFWSLSWGERRVCMPAETLPIFRELFDDTEQTWVLANAKYDAHILANYGTPLQGRLIDTQVMHALLYEDKPHNLKYMSEHILGWRWADFFDTFKAQRILDPNTGEERKEAVGEMLLRVYKEDPQTLVEYASNDAYGTMKVYEALKKELQAHHTYSLYPDHFPTLWDVFWKTEVPFTRVLWKCERKGVLIDDDYLKSVETPVQRSVNDLMREIWKVRGKPINPGSPKQMREYFFDELGLKPVSYTKGGKTGVKNPKVDAEFLEYYKGDVPLAKLILEHRELDKLLGTYVKGLPQHYDRNGRIHCKFNQDVARTGRLSSSEPNLQNIPNAEADKFKVRRAFIAPPGKKLLCLDYSALEMRLLAAASQEKDMIDIFLKGWDIHMGNASMVFGMPYEDIAKAKKKDKADLTDYDVKCLDARRNVKAIGFGLNYGMKEKLLAANIGCPVEEAVELMERYMGRYPAVKKFYAEAIEETRQTLCAFTLLGRCRHLPLIRSGREFERWQAERQAVNMQIQGTAADVARMAMIAIHESGLEERYGCDMLMQVHDELVFECPEETCDEALAEIKEWMEHPLLTDLDVPLTVEGGSADNWAEAK